MATRTETLRPHEQLMLLALRDDKGTLESKASMHSFALGGALLAELSLHGRDQHRGVEEGAGRPGGPAAFRRASAR